MFYRWLWRRSWAAYPQGASPTSNPQVWNYVADANHVDKEDSGMLRIDQHFSDKTTAYLRYSADEADYTIPTGALNALAKTGTKLCMVEPLHVFSPSFAKRSQIRHQPEHLSRANLSSIPFTLGVSNLSPLTGSSTTDGDGTTFSYLDDMTWVKARHILKFGVETRRII
jgi:hypothetical protein